MSWNGVKMIRNIRSGLENLLLHKLRSFLTMLGVVFGVGSVVAMLSVGEGAAARPSSRSRSSAATTSSSRPSSRSSRNRPTPTGP